MESPIARTPDALLSAERLRPARPFRRLCADIRILSEVDSTNSYLLAQADALPDGAVLFAEHQTSGRGRLGRRWAAPRGSSLLLSVLFFEQPGASTAALSTLIGAVAACEAIEAATDCRPTLRWPNDVLISGRKVAGVLVETRRRGTGSPPLAVVLGIGINCLQQRGHFPPELGETATSLELESPQPIDRAAVAAALLARLDAWLSAEKSFEVAAADRRDAAGAPGVNAGAQRAPLLAAWRQRCEPPGTRIRLQHDGRMFAGTMLDVDEAGDLLVELDEGGRRLFAAATTTRLK